MRSSAVTESASTPSSQRFDVILVGGGIMSTTLGAILKELQPDWSIALFEKLDGAGQESSDPWNNAGTGHTAYCELNYTPRGADGAISTAKAAGIAEQFHVSRQLWSHWTENGTLGAPRTFINALPHISFVWGEKNTQYLRDRYEAMRKEPLFAHIEHAEDLDTIGSWAPLLAAGRTADKPVAASQFRDGTDVDFGSITRQLAGHLGAEGVELRYGHEVTGLSRGTDGRWEMKVKNTAGGEKFTASARFVFVGAGGGALGLLQSSGIREIRGFGGFPVSGQFLRATESAIAEQHHAKVYGLASVGAPPMSVPHLDTRFVEGRRSLMFGPYAGFSTNFLKSGSYLDLPFSVRPHNLLPMLQVGATNTSLVSYLLKEVTKSQRKKVAALQEFYPEADGEQWELITAGQRVQVMKKDERGKGVLQFGTELIAAADGSIAGLLGASPGASTAPSIMFKLLERCFPGQIEGWRPQLETMVPSYGQLLNENEKLLAEVTESTAKTLQLDI
ncbi:malate:quinone oxidoreductase [Nesterenkonia alkaliphila]|uniref:Probable malate:quinone oxidoreductase n=1 Tax=Nesterenkonia alkaliphila TaxID=1463631 RepID=A0A7K1UH79_9MICC|nr:malate:quinone oxidoreductase [Nesterenkonia alkaliphila]MVT25799.1 malate:quinone oxidoreductase [Nesterenkonia alkaliphila]